VFIKRGKPQARRMAAEYSDSRMFEASLIHVIHITGTGFMLQELD